MLKGGPDRCPGCMAPIAGSGDCQHCGYSSKSEYDLKYLRPGVTLKDGRYLVGKLERKNGEGATYISYDNQNNQVCQLREYFPTAFSRRHPVTGEVMPIEGYDAQFKAFISDFVDVCNEVKRLAVTEKVIPIRDVFSDNNTLYAVYKHIDVVSFDKYLAQNGGKISLSKAYDIFLPFCNMVGNIHDNGYIHRGISPYTIYVDKDENLYLWDFSLGATRTADSGMESELFNGYSAPEQYSPNGWQGPWTDVYALGALFYRMVSGFVPPKSILVGEGRPLTRLDDLVMDIPRGVADAVGDAMAQRTELRTQAVYSFTAGLMGNSGSNTAVYDTGKSKWQEPEPERGPERVRTRARSKETEKDGGFKYAILALIFTVVALFCGLIYMTKTFFPSMLDNDEFSKAPSHSFEEFEESINEIAQGSEFTSDEIEVPRFVGQMLTAIEGDEDYMNKFDFSVREEMNNDFPAGVVFKQVPAPDAKIALKGTVTLYISKGPELVVMPSIIGINTDDAIKSLSDRGIQYIKEERYAAGAVPGSVVGTVPAPGAEINPQKDTVTLYVMPAGQPEESQSEESSQTDESSKESGEETAASSKITSNPTGSSSSKKASNPGESGGFNKANSSKS